MAKCKDCIHFPICEPHTDPNESYPEVGGCPAFKSKSDFAEVVRCKDCGHYHEQVCPIWCYTGTKPDDFCSYGERREGE